MPAQSVEIKTRNLSPEDEARLIEICYLTGTTVLDKYLFALRWCLYYLWYEAENSFAAVDTASGQVVGYILGTLETAAQEAHFRQVVVPKIKTYWRSSHRKTLRTWAAYRALLRTTDSSLFHDLYAQYPAHLHINTHPDHQRKGIGHKLIQAYEANLMARGVPGYHLLVGGDNEIGIAFYRKLGLTELKKVPPAGKSLVIAFGKTFK
ncbi:MAG TPA: GNAT family N-acetyltransferase [Anaerolineales bacterium]|nr:GNAT family N-acetyltransferase [Anaerolineales bacterium]